MIRVDHLHPRHDDFCRCRACKPPLDEARLDFRLARLTYAGAIVAMGVLLGRGA